jgi:hypothetical protein
MDIIMAILINIIAWTIVSTTTSGIERILLYIVIVLTDAAFVYKKFKD